MMMPASMRLLVHVHSVPGGEGFKEVSGTKGRRGEDESWVLGLTEAWSCEVEDTVARIKKKTSN